MVKFGTAAAIIARHPRGKQRNLKSESAQKGRERAMGLLNALQLIDISNNLGDAKTLMTHPASTTHSSVSPEVRAQMGVREDMVRISVGLEDVEDLKDDLDRALKTIGL